MAYGTGHEVSRMRGKRPSSVHTRRVPRARFYMIAGSALAAAAVLLILLLQGAPTFRVEQGSKEYTAGFEMLILRDETVYTAKNCGKADFIAQEGSHVEKGEPVVKIYELGYNENTVSELLEHRKTILDYEINVSRAGVIDPKLGEIESRISSKALEIQTAVTNADSKSLLSLERQMRALLDEKREYLRSVVVPDDQLRKLLSKESELSATIDGWSMVVNSQTSGTVSFYFDGCEALMAKENIGSFTKKTLEELLAGKTINTSAEQKSIPLYRVVNEDHWFVVLLSEKQIPEMFMGNSFLMIFDDYLDKKYTGTLYDQQKLENNGGFVYTIRIQGDIGPMLGDRRVSAKLFSTIKGFRIPKYLLKPSGGVQYVQRESGELVPVLIVADDGDSVLVQSYRGQPSLKAGELLKK